MVLLRSLIAVASIVGYAHSQSAVTINPDSIPEDTRAYWCSEQVASCPLLCLQLPGASDSPTSNDCDSDTLQYSCVCNNGKSPNASEYSQTIPYFICTEQNNVCVKNCNHGDSNCQYNCRADNPCGAQNPKRANVTSTPGSTATNTASATTSLAPFTGLPEEGFAVRPTTDLARVYGLCAVLGGFFAGFAVLL